MISLLLLLFLYFALLLNVKSRHVTYTYITFRYLYSRTLRERLGTECFFLIINPVIPPVFYQGWSEQHKEPVNHKIIDTTPPPPPPPSPAGNGFQKRVTVDSLATSGVGGGVGGGQSCLMATAFISPTKMQGNLQIQ